MEDIRLLDERFWDAKDILFNTLFKHRGHKVEIVVYGDWNNPDDVCLECADCNQIILDSEIYTICGKDEIK